MIILKAIQLLALGIEKSQRMIPILSASKNRISFLITLQEMETARQSMANPILINIISSKLNS